MFGRGSAATARERLWLAIFLLFRDDHLPCLWNTLDALGKMPPRETEPAPEVADLLRDIAGNPFRPVAFDPDWRSEAAVGIAAKMYDEREFAAMPILADALQEAGCENEGVLSHCRGPGIHVRGCWVVDLVLGKG